MWTMDAVEREWLRGGRIAYHPHDVVDAFNVVERTLGRVWMEASRTFDGMVAWGPNSTAAIVDMGQQLASLEGVVGAEELITRLKRNDESANAELTAVHLLRRDRPSAEVELGPVVTVGTGSRKPDFRVRAEASDPWTYVEVAQPDVSEIQERVQALMNHLIAPIRDAKKSYGLEVFLRREPMEREVDRLVSRIRELCSSDGLLREELPDGLGLLLLNHTQPGMVILDDHGEPHVPRLGRTQFIRGGSEPHRHIAVRLAFSDERAESFLTTEARQLPTEAPGLIMIQVGRAPGGFTSWEPLIIRRFQPTIHTRVSAVCLLGGGWVPTPDGEKLLPQTKLLRNPHAALPLPRWIAESLTKAGEEFDRYTSPDTTTSL